MNTPPVDVARAVAVYPDGRVIVAGVTSDNQIGLVRYHPNGALDTSFGGGFLTEPGIVKFRLNNNVTAETAEAIALQPDGKILLATRAPTLISLPFGGFVVQAMAVVRLSPTGGRDTTFGNNGVAHTAGSFLGENAKALTLLPTGRHSGRR